MWQSFTLLYTGSKLLIGENKVFQNKFPPTFVWVFLAEEIGVFLLPLGCAYMDCKVKFVIKPSHCIISNLLSSKEIIEYNRKWHPRIVQRSPRTQRGFQSYLKRFQDSLSLISSLCPPRSAQQHHARTTRLHRFQQYTKFPSTNSYLRQPTYSQPIVIDVHAQWLIRLLCPTISQNPHRSRSNLSTHITSHPHTLLHPTGT